MRKVIPLALLILPTLLFGANIHVPELEMVTRGIQVGSDFTLTTITQAELEIEGGSKFGGYLKFQFSNPATESVFLSTTPKEEQALLFNGAGVQIRDMFNLPINLLYFLGELDPFSSGEEFPELFGSRIISTYYRGFLYFPDVVDPDPLDAIPAATVYDGIYTPKGTGLQFSTNQNLSSFYITDLYIYQDGILGPGIYSADWRHRFNFEAIKLEFFGGSSFPVTPYGVYRGGMLFFAEAGERGEFLVQLGVPYWDPDINGALNTDLIFLLLEPRLNFGLLNIITTLMHHPQYYNQEATLEEGSMDINFNFLLGDPAEDPLAGGIETTLKASTIDDADLTITTSPYIKAISQGTFWDFKVNFKVFPFDLHEFYEVFLGVRAEF